MGRQIEFYFGELDEWEFLKNPVLNDTAILTMWDLQSPKAEIYQDFNKPFVSNASAQTCICLKKDIANVKFLGSLGKEHYYIDTFDSPIIEFIRSGLNAKSNILIPGRFWFEKKYWDKDEQGNDILVSKSEELEKLYNGLVRWVKKTCQRLPNGKYIGPHAMKIHQDGAKLGGDF